MIVEVMIGTKSTRNWGESQDKNSPPFFSCKAIEHSWMQWGYISWEQSGRNFVQSKRSLIGCNSEGVHCTYNHRINIFWNIKCCYCKYSCTSWDVQGSECVNKGVVEIRSIKIKCGNFRWLRLSASCIVGVNFLRNRGGILDFCSKSFTVNLSQIR